MSSTHSQRRVYAVLTAAGSGTRLGCDEPKALVPIDGEPMLRHATHGLLDAGVDGIIITAPATHLAEFEAAVAPLGAIPLCIVAGGATRQASVAAGLAAVASLRQENGDEGADDAVILVHDAARALTPPAMIRRVIDAVLGGSNAVIPALPVSDTLKVIDRSTAKGATQGSVTATADRSTLVAVQTPQGFHWDTIYEAHERNAHLNHDETLAATDDAGLVEALGGRVDIVLGDSEALKITTPWDLRLAHNILSSRHP